MRKILLALTLVTLAAAPAAAQNILGNPGFETPFPNPTTSVANWATFGSGALGSATQVTTTPRTGTRHINLSTGGMNQFAGIYQDIDVPIAGKSITYSGWHRAITNPVGSVSEIKFEWVGAAQEVITSQIPGPNYTQFSITRSPPAGATDLRVTYAIATFAAGLGESVIYLDDFSVTVVPEPTAAVFAAAILLLMPWIRRR